MKKKLKNIYSLCRDIVVDNNGGWDSINYKDHLIKTYTDITDKEYWEVVILHNKKISVCNNGDFTLNLGIKMKDIDNIINYLNEYIKENEI